MLFFFIKISSLKTLLWGQNPPRTTGAISKRTAKDPKNSVFRQKCSFGVCVCVCGVVECTHSVRPQLNGSYSPANVVNSHV